MSKLKLAILPEHNCFLFVTKGRLQNLKTVNRVKSCIKGGGGQFRIIILKCLERMTYPKGGRGAQLHCHDFRLWEMSVFGSDRSPRSQDVRVCV